MWTPTKEWLGQDAFLIGGGSTLQAFDFSQLKGANTIGCNDAFRLGEEVVKICLFADASFWAKNKFLLEKFKNRIVTCGPVHAKVPWLLKMDREKKGLHTDSVLGLNYSTGAAAVNLAISLGATRIFLLGYDMRQIQGKSHWHNHRKKVTSDQAFGRFLRGFECVASSLSAFPDVKIFNVGNGTSLLPTFKKISFQEMKEMRQ